MKREIEVGYKYPERILKRELMKLIGAFDGYNTINVVCIGSDRATGDCLGPLVGTFLENGIKNDFIKVYGTLELPVHALNLSDLVEKINKENSLTIAVDASLSNPEEVGKIVVRKGAIAPGSGIGKELPQVGDISITGVVNIFGPLSDILITTTRLSIVYNLSKTIAKSLKSALYTLQKESLIKESINEAAMTKW